MDWVAHNLPALTHPTVGFGPRRGVSSTLGVSRGEVGVGGRDSMFFFSLFLVGSTNGDLLGYSGVFRASVHFY